MLLCGFENFKNFYVRIDILERLFVQIISSNDIKEKSQEIKVIPEMLNLLGCNKENFKKLLKNMNYSVVQKKDDIYFKYAPKKIKNKNFNQKTLKTKESPFGILKNLNLT